MSVDPANATPPQPAPSHSGFTVLIATMALLFSIGATLAVAFKLNDMHSGSSGVTMVSAGHRASMMGGSGSYGTGVAGPGSATEEVNLVVKSDEEHAKRGPEGTWHDAFLPADFSVAPGAT